MRHGPNDETTGVYGNGPLRELGTVLRPRPLTVESTAREKRSQAFGEFCESVPPVVES